MGTLFRLGYTKFVSLSSSIHLCILQYIRSQPLKEYDVSESFLQASLALAEEDWGINLQSLCPIWTDTKLIQEAGMDAKQKMIVSPATPGEECKKYVHNRVHSSHIMR